jgi:serine protease
VAGNTSATVAFAAPAGGFPADSFSIVVRTGTTVVRTVDGVPGSATSHQVTGLSNGTAYNFQVRAVNSAGESPLSAASNEVTPRVPAYVPPAVSPFADVATNHPFYREIAWLAERRISEGWREADGTFTYRPWANVNRDQMAAFLFRMSGPTDYTPPAVSRFTDVPTSHTFYKEIAWLADQGISNGWPGANNTATFRPADTINRDQMAAFLYRMSGTADYTPPAVSPFIDVPTSHTFYKEIAWLADQNISNGWPEANNTASFRASEKINRDQMAAFLYRMSNRAAG